MKHQAATTIRRTARSVRVDPRRERVDPGFLIVGTPRSGTTLVQRLACELPGVGMPPETHFLGFFALEMLARRTFPLSGETLRHELDAFARIRTSVELGLDVDAVYEDVSGYCITPLEMFGAIVRALAPEARIYGEKSPEHLLWWRPLATASPDLKVITVVRDPRAVVTSMLEAWAPATERGVDHHILRAERWAADQRVAVDAAENLGDRHLLLRYEDVVADPVAARAAIADFLDIEISLDHDDVLPAPRIVLPRESWKARTFDAITAERVEVWRSALTGSQQAAIAAICADGMRRFGYASDAKERRGVAPIRTQWRRARFRAGRYRQQRAIERTVL